MRYLYAAGELALAFANTLPAEGGLDPLASADGLSRWLAESSPTARAAVSPESLPHARWLVPEAQSLRGEVRTALSAVAEGEPILSEALWNLNACLWDIAQLQTLSPAGPGPTELGAKVRLTHSVHALGPRAPLGLVARDAAYLLTTVRPDRVRRCASEACVRWFVDVSKGGRRRWCSMATCGNRAKAARHRARRGAAPAGE